VHPQEHGHGWKWDGTLYFDEDERIFVANETGKFLHMLHDLPREFVPILSKSQPKRTMFAVVIDTPMKNFDGKLFFKSIIQL
jgi:hypothetical protein